MLPIVAIVFASWTAMLTDGVAFCPPGDLCSGDGRIPDIVQSGFGSEKSCKVFLHDKQKDPPQNFVDPKDKGGHLLVGAPWYHYDKAKCIDDSN